MKEVWKKEGTDGSFNKFFYVVVEAFRGPDGTPTAVFSSVKCYRPQIKLRLSVMKHNVVPQKRQNGVFFFAWIALEILSSYLYFEGDLNTRVCTCIFV